MFPVILCAALGILVVVLIWALLKLRKVFKLSAATLLIYMKNKGLPSPTEDDLQLPFILACVDITDWEQNKKIRVRFKKSRYWNDLKGVHIPASTRSK